MFRTHESADVPRAPVAPLLLALLLVLALVACSGPDPADGSAAASDSTSDEKSSTKVAVTEAKEATVGVAANAGESEGSSGAPFVSRTESSGGSSYQADTLLGVRYGSHDGYERVVLDLGTGDRPAGKVPEWNLMSPEREGVVRVTLPSVSRTDVSDGRLGDALLDGFYVVRAPDGGVFVDVFARKAFAYRVLELSDPARLVVDFEPTGEPLKSQPPAVGGDTVLVEPRAGARAGDPLTVSGYSRNFEASNTIVLTDPEGETVVSQTVTGNDWSSTWGYFEATLDLRPFTGKGILQVGTSSARDGSFQGVEVPVRGG